MDDANWKKEVLREWNEANLVQEMPYRPLQFASFDDLYRYLRGVARKQGSQDRKTLLNRTEVVNIKPPAGTGERKQVMTRRKADAILTTSTAMRFLRRIKVLKEQRS